MSVTNDDNVETSFEGQYQFVRNSKLRQSIRIRDRPLNRKLPASALIYMKSLEKNANNIKDPIKTELPAKAEKPNVKKSISLDIMEISDQEDSDESPLIRRKNSKRASVKGVKKSSAKKHKRLNRLINFFR